MEKIIAQIIVENYIRRVEVSKPRKPKMIVYKDGSFVSGKQKLPVLRDAITERKRYCLAVLHKDGTKTLLQLFGVPKNPKFNDDRVSFAPTDMVEFKHAVRRTTKWQASDKLVVYDMREGLPVITNIRTVGKPKTVNVNGNILYAGIHHSVRVAVVNALKARFKEAIKRANVQVQDEDYPVQVRLTVIDNIDSALNGSNTWDLDNRSYIYNKVFCDTLRDTIIPDDSIRYIAALSVQFIPLDMYDDPGITEPTLIFDIIKIGGGVQEYIREVFS